MSLPSLFHHFFYSCCYILFSVTSQPYGSGKSWFGNSFLSKLSQDEALQRQLEDRFSSYEIKKLASSMYHKYLWIQVTHWLFAIYVEIDLRNVIIGKCNIYQDIDVDSYFVQIVRNPILAALKSTTDSGKCTLTTEFNKIEDSLAQCSSLFEVWSDKRFF